MPDPQLPQEGIIGGASPVPDVWWSVGWAKESGWLFVLARVLYEHRIVLNLAVGYLVFGGALLLWLGRPWPVRLSTPLFLTVWSAGSAAWLAAAFLRSPRAWRACLQPVRLCGAVLVALLAVPVQITFQALKQAIVHTIGFHWDATFAVWDNAIHRGPAWRWFETLLNNRTSVRVLDLIYMSWFVLLLIVAIWACWTPHRALRQRTLIAILILWIGAGTIGAALASSAGPCYVDRPEYRELLARLDAHGTLFARLNQQGLQRLQEADLWGPLAGVSAMPSLHVAFAVLATYLAWARTRWLGAVAAAYAIAIQVGSVALGWHYAIDGYVGAVLGWGSWTLASRWTDSKTEWPTRRT